MSFGASRNRDNRGLSTRRCDEADCMEAQPPRRTPGLDMEDDARPSPPAPPAIDAAPLKVAIGLCVTDAILFAGVEITQHPINITFAQWFWLLAMSCCVGTMLLFFGASYGHQPISHHAGARAAKLDHPGPKFVIAAILFTQVGVYSSPWSTVEGEHRWAFGMFFIMSLGMMVVCGSRFYPNHGFHN